MNEFATALGVIALLLGAGVVLLLGLVLAAVALPLAGFHSPSLVHS